MRCSRCGGGLEAIVERGVEIDRCAGCALVFFDAGELDRYARGTVEAALHRVRDEGSETEARCPRCEGPMRTIRTGAGSIAACTLCAGLLMTWTGEVPLLLDLRPLPKRDARTSVLGGGGDFTSDLLIHGGPGLVDLADVADGAGSVLEGGAEFIGGLLGAIGEILGGLG